MAIVSGIRTFRGVVEISSDGVSCLRVREKDFEKKPLQQGDVFDSEEYQDAVSQFQLNEAYERALTSLDFSARTAQEIRKTLLNKGFVAPVVEAVIERLTENRLIDDQRYAQRAVELSQNRPVGVYAMKRKLRSKGISEEDAEVALELMDDGQQEQAALLAAQKMAKKYAVLPPREGRAKLSQALARRGFPWEAIRSAVDKVLSGDDEDFDTP